MASVTGEAAPSRQPLVLRALAAFFGIPAFALVLGALLRRFPDFVLDPEFLLVLAISSIVSALLLGRPARRWPRSTLALSPILAVAILILIGYLMYGDPR